MSTKPRIYLDFNASAPLLREARDSMAEAMALVGNPSSIHAEGRAVRDRVERARNAVAALVGRPREQIVFTSGGTEANHLGVLGLAAVAEKRGLPRVVATTPIEHPSLRGAIDALAVRGWGVVHLPVATTAVGLLAVGLVNHELGTILPEGAIAWARRMGALVHLDAVQAAGKLNLDAFDADAMAISAHKIGGPQGMGALAIAFDDGLPIIGGGHQERGRRAGTENVVGIAGFGAAAAAIDVATWPRVTALGDRLEAGLVAMGARIHGKSHGPADADLWMTNRVGGTINAGFAGALGESIVIALDLAGVAVSTGAACTSGSVQPSPVLLGIGMPAERAREAVRFSLGRSTTAEEIDEVLRILPALVDRARRR
jgi:cysteine desulfurase